LRPDASHSKKVSYAYNLSPVLHLAVLAAIAARVVIPIDWGDHGSTSCRLPWP
jgi:hypothetical protein